MQQLDLISTAEKEPKAAKEIRLTLKSDLLNEGLLKGELLREGDNLGITYKFKRIKRLSRDRAFGLLMAYTGVLSRPAYQREFA